jgi:hypothetical protein
LDHITMVTANKPSLTWMVMGGPPPNNATGTAQIYNVSLTNFIVSSGPNGFYTTGGGPNNCAFGGMSDYARLVSACWKGNSRLTNNLITTEFFKAGYKGTWPAGNLFASDPSGVGFQNFMTEGGDYHLAATSPYKYAGTD